MAKRFFNTARIDEDWYLALSLKHRELLRYCESKCDGAGVFSFNSTIASTYVSQKVTESDLAKIGAEKLANGKFWLTNFITEQNSELKESCPAHKPIFKSIQENQITLSNRVFNRVINTQQEKEIVIEKEIEKEKELEIEKEDAAKSLHVQMRTQFTETYQRKKSIPFAWDGKSGKHLNELISKIKFTTGEKSDESVLDFWKALLENMPDWYLNNGFTPAVINSKFNELIGKIHKPNGTNNTNHQRAAAEYRAKHGTPQY